MKKFGKKQILQFLSLLLSIVLSSGMFISCNKNDDQTNETSGNVYSGEVTRPESLSDGLDPSQTMNELDKLAFLNTHTITGSFAPYARDGTNWDGGTGTYVYEEENPDYDPNESEYNTPGRRDPEREKTTRVLADLKGKGSITRIWFTGDWHPTKNILRVYVDGETTPSVEADWITFTSFGEEPFTDPVCKDWRESAGGKVSYVPINFNESIKITINGLWEDDGYPHVFYTIDYVLYPNDYKLNSYTSDIDTDLMADKMGNCGVDPKSGVNNIRYEVQETKISDGTSAEIFNRSLKGQVNIIKLKLNDFSAETATPSNKYYMNLLNNTYLQVFYDGQPNADVNAPIGSFFGVGTLGYQQKVQSLMVGVNDDPKGGPSTLYCYFPMPFYSQVQIKLLNKTGEEINASGEIYYTPVDYDFYNVGYFKTQYTNTYVEAHDSFDAIFADIDGSGKVVGIQENLFGPTGIVDMNFEEGDTRIYLDNNPMPAVHSTGTEDFYNGAGYFIDANSRAKRGFFSIALAGYTAYAFEHDDGTWQYEPYGMVWDTPMPGRENASMYRFFIHDAISFNSNFKIGFEHGGGHFPTGNDYYLVPNRSVGYETLVFYYHQNITRQHLSDVVDLGNTDNLSDHNFSILKGEISPDEVEKGVNGSFIGNFKDYKFAMSGQKIAPGGEYEFKVAIDPQNYGVTLRRFFNLNENRQWADIYVDNMFAGTFYTADGKSEGYDYSGKNVYYYGTNDVQLDRTLTKGKSEITIKIVNRSDIRDFTAFKYEVYSLADKVLMNKAPLASGDTIRISYNGKYLTANGTQVQNPYVMQSEKYFEQEKNVSQDFRIVEFYNGMFSITSLQNGMALDIFENVLSQTYINDSTENMNKLFEIHFVDDTHFKLYNIVSGKYLQVYDNYSPNFVLLGTQLKLADEGTVFTFEKVTERKLQTLDPKGAAPFRTA